MSTGKQHYLKVILEIIRYLISQNLAYEIEGSPMKGYTLLVNSTPNYWKRVLHPEVLRIMASYNELCLVCDLQREVFGKPPYSYQFRILEKES